MSNTKRNEQQLRIWSRRAKVMDLYLRGVCKNQYEMAARLGMDPINGQKTICDDVKAIKKRLKEQATSDLEEFRSIQLAKLQLLESKLWADLERVEKGITSVTEKEQLAAVKAKRKKPRRGSEEDKQLFAVVRMEREKKKMKRTCEGLAAVIVKVIAEENDLMGIVRNRPGESTGNPPVIGFVIHPPDPPKQIEIITETATEGNTNGHQSV